MSEAISSKDRNYGRLETHLFDLPREVRDQIYGYVLASDADFIRPITASAADQLRSSCGITRRLAIETGHEAWPFPKNREYVTTTAMDISILLVDKQIHDEAEKVLVEQHSVLLSTIGQSWEQHGWWMSCGSQREEIQALVERMLRITQYARQLWVRLECPLRAKEPTVSFEKQLSLVLLQQQEQRKSINPRIMSCLKLEQEVFQEQIAGRLSKARFPHRGPMFSQRW